MDFNGLQTLSLSFVVQDALIAAGAGVALLACLAFINLGIFLPGLLTSLGGPRRDEVEGHAVTPGAKASTRRIFIIGSPTAPLS